MSQAFTSLYKWLMLPLMLAVMISLGAYPLRGPR
jgi:hypothetical protein